MDYPIILSYTTPDGVDVKVRINNDGESEDAYDEMFMTCGPYVCYSVDDVDIPACNIVSAVV